MSKLNPNPMFKMLLETLKNESEATKGMFFADTEENLMKAYQEGVEARNKKIPITKNPYPEPKGDDLDSGKYNMNLCWGEGFLATFVNEKD